MRTHPPTPATRDLITAAIAVLLFTVLLGGAYPLVVTGVSQVAYPNKADGSPIERDGKVVGSKLIGQDFSRPVLGADGQPRQDADGEPVTEPDPKYFQGRPSATGNDPSATFFANRGPNQRTSFSFHRDALRAYVELERPYTPDLRTEQVPVDAVTDSASGVDPHISEENARIQARRVAAVRRIPLDRVERLIDDHTDGRFLGLIGEPGVNVVELNLAIDEEAR